MDIPIVHTYRGPFMAALAAYRRASVFAGPSFAHRVNAAVDADPGLWVNGRPTHWTLMNVRNQEADLAPVTETTCRRYAAGLGDFEAFVVIVPKGATRVLVEIHDEPERAHKTKTEIEVPECDRDDSDAAVATSIAFCV